MAGLFKPNIQKMQARRDARGLVKILRTSKDHAITSPAEEALVAIGPEAIQPLQELAEDRTMVTYTLDLPYARNCAYQALARIKDPSVVEILIRGLDDASYTYTGKVLVDALGKSGDPRAVEPLIAHLQQRIKDVDRVVEESHKAKETNASTSFGNFLAKSRNEELQAFASALIWALKDLKDPRAIPVLLEIARSERRTYAKQAMEAVKTCAYGGKLDGKWDKIHMVSVWSSIRTGIFTIKAHNQMEENLRNLDGTLGGKTDTILRQTYEHEGNHVGCLSCERVISAYLEDRHARPAGYELGDGNLHTYY